jgi:hypothetical protein
MGHHEHDKTANVTLRFYGRFFYAEAMRNGKPANRMLAIAPNFDAKLFGKHQALMTVERKQVSFGAAGEATTVQPKFRNVSDVKDITKAEYYVWDLSGLRVSYGLEGPVSLKPQQRNKSEEKKHQSSGDRKVLDVAELERLMNRPKPTLVQNAFTPDASGVSNAIIEVTSGEGIAKPVLENGIELATSGEIKRADAARVGGGSAVIQTIPNPGTDQPVRAVPADLVEFEVPLKAGASALRLKFQDGSGKDVGIVTVKAGTTIAFSNLCSEIRKPEFQDMEFTQYYGLLSSAPPKAEVLVPVDAAATGGGNLSEGADCDIQARLEFEL